MRESTKGATSGKSFVFPEFLVVSGYILSKNHDSGLFRHFQARVRVQESNFKSHSDTQNLYQIVQLDELSRLVQTFFVGAFTSFSVFMLY